MILPSLLEYSNADLINKLDLIQSRKNDFLTLAGQNILTLHLDIVMQRFAQDRGALMSLSLETVLGKIKTYFYNETISLSIHLMGDTEDLYKANQFLTGYKKNSKWGYVFYVPEKFYNSWSAQFSHTPYSFGIWYDLGEWKYQTFVDNYSYLLMTVHAGKSGQIAYDADKKNCEELSQNNPKSQFIFDGGWGLSEQPTCANASIVSYSSFWKKLTYVSSL